MSNQENTPKYVDITIPYMSPATSHKTRSNLFISKMKSNFYTSLKVNDKLLSSC